MLQHVLDQTTDCSQPSFWLPDERPPAVNRDLEQWFFIDPEPRFLVNAAGKSVAHNEAAQAALDDGLLNVSAIGSIHFGSPDCEQRFLAAVRQVTSVGSGQTRIAVRQRHGGWFAGSVSAVPNRPMAILSLREELIPTAASMRAIGDGFKLTRCELDVLGYLLEGKCPKSAAAELDVSEHTVRAHLRGIYAKMGVRGLSNAVLRACTFL